MKGQCRKKFDLWVFLYIVIKKPQELEELGRLYIRSPFLQTQNNDIDMYYYF